MTSDPVLDSWFSILFSFVAFNERQSCTIANMSSLISGLLSWSSDQRSMLFSTFLNQLLVFNYWHLLEFLYFPLNIDFVHWILVRVGVKTEMVEIFDSLGTEFNLESQEANTSFTKSYFILIILQLVSAFLLELQTASWKQAQKKGIIAQETQLTPIKKQTFEQPNLCYSFLSNGKY